ncbi:MAG: MOSC domain-containing protein [Pseudorhodobacter sp.]
MTPITIDRIFAGQVEELWPGRPPSAIRKKPVADRAEISELGLTVDAQADLSVHGGLDKALHHYPSEHYENWCAELDRRDLCPGSFGENFSTFGLTEKTACIGDIFEIGSAKVQISQGRQPCWKLNAHTSEDRMAFLFQKTGRTGWYYRVLERGAVAPDDTMKLIERINPGWSVEQVTRARLTKKIALSDAAYLAALPQLAEGWRRAFGQMACGDLNEDTGPRLKGR